ncbi:MAG: hypothetical protein EOM24_20225, partial [Chloroflexia bacterium]|nr:hypothetical protein [Chloroflexia bacterium]
MKQFLRETWQIWYWAYFHPSRLQAWMREMRDDEVEARTRLIAVFRKPPFATRFALLALLLLAPLISMVAWQGQPLDWLLVLTALVCLYGLTLFPLAISLTTPWLFLLVYSLHPDAMRQALVVTGEILPPWPQLVLGMGVYTLGLVATSQLGTWLWQQERVWLGRLTLVAGLTCSVVLGAWLATNIWEFTIVLALLISILSIWAVRDEPRRGGLQAWMREMRDDEV